MHLQRFFGRLKPDPRQLLPNVTIWKRCGAAWRVVRR